VVEVVSEESADRDRSLKLFKSAQARIAQFWRFQAGAPAVHAYELDGMTRTYVPTGIHRGRLKVPVPFPLDIDLDALVPYLLPSAARGGQRAADLPGREDLAAIHSEPYASTVRQPSRLSTGPTTPSHTCS
jgi:hypothetical protein